jgi:prevent-host-death family protein
MNKTVSIYEAKAHLSRLVREVGETGAVVVINRHGRPMVDMVPHRDTSDPLRQDPKLKGAKYHQDPCAPVSPKDWPEDQR